MMNVKIKNMELLAAQRLFNTIISNMDLKKELGKDSVKSVYAATKNMGRVESKMKVLQEEEREIRIAAAEKDESGKPKVNDKGHLIYKPELQEEMVQDVSNLLEKENEIELHAFPDGVIDKVLHMLDGDSTRFYMTHMYKEETVEA